MHTRASPVNRQPLEKKYIYKFIFIFHRLDYLLFTTILSSFIPLLTHSLSYTLTLSLSLLYSLTFSPSLQYISFFPSLSLSYTISLSLSPLHIILPVSLLSLSLSTVSLFSPFFLHPLYFVQYFKI